MWYKNINVIVVLLLIKTFANASTVHYITNMFCSDNYMCPDANSYQSTLAHEMCDFTACDERPHCGVTELLCPMYQLTLDIVKYFNDKRQEYALKNYIRNYNAFVFSYIDVFSAICYSGRCSKETYVKCIGCHHSVTHGNDNLNTLGYHYIVSESETGLKGQIPSYDFMKGLYHKLSARMWYKLDIVKRFHWGPMGCALRAFNIDSRHHTWDMALTCSFRYYIQEESFYHETDFGAPSTDQFYCNPSLCTEGNCNYRLCHTSTTNDELFPQEQYPVDALNPSDKKLWIALFNRNYDDTCKHYKINKLTDTHFYISTCAPVASEIQTPVNIVKPEQEKQSKELLEDFRKWHLLLQESVNILDKNISGLDEDTETKGIGWKNYPNITFKMKSKAESVRCITSCLYIFIILLNMFVAGNLLFCY